MTKKKYKPFRVKPIKTSKTSLTVPKIATVKEHPEKLRSIKFK